VKVQFHWDREGKKDENSSCWMRVSQIHAGKGFGAISIPRIGEEVIVSFLEGDPDCPIITGRVYHAENMPPYGLPDSKVISGIKSNSTKGGGGYNEYVMDDTKGKELIREHGQYDKDSTIENDLREHVLNNRSRDVSVDEKVTIGSNQSISVGSNRTISVGSNQEVGIGSNQTTTIGSNDTTSIGAKQEIAIGASRSISISANDELTVGGTQKIGVAGPIEISSDASITLTVGASTITIEPASISLKSTKITIEADAAVETKGATITSQAMGINEVKGGTVKLN
jgi:type VI secretion system secreted protein VgrG